MEFKGVIYMNEEPADEGLIERLPEDLAAFYKDINGIIAFNGGLQIRSCDSSDHWNSLERFWQGDDSFAKVYPNVLPSDIPFGQDCVGDQFLLREDRVHLLSAETGEVMDMEVSFDEFLESCAEDPVDYLAMEPLVHYLSLEETLEAGQLVHVTPGLSLDLPEDTAYHIDAMSIEERLKWLSEFYAGSHRT